MKKIDIAMFAHNEESRIRDSLNAFMQQSIFRNDKFDVKLIVLANGCNDQTVDICQKIKNDHQHINFAVENIEVGGKSRTWNYFTHNISRNNAEYLIYCDADIYFSDSETLTLLADYIDRNKTLKAVPSKPVKDLSVADRLTITEKIILKSASMLDDWKSSICGQLYAVRSSVARNIWMPIGLPVEDGFIRALIITNNLTDTESPDFINSDDKIFHLYKSENTLVGLIKHQVRIVIGGAINSLLFSIIGNTAAEKRTMMLKEISENEIWLGSQIKHHLPAAPHGWVPLHFLFKRVNNLVHNPSRWKPSSLFVALIGFSFDFVVFVLAQVKMARGHGANYW